MKKKLACLCALLMTLTGCAWLPQGTNQLADNYTGTYYYNFLDSTGDSDTWEVNFDDNTVTATINGTLYKPSEMTLSQRDYNWNLLCDHTENPPYTHEPEIHWTPTEVETQADADENGFINKTGVSCQVYNMKDYSDDYFCQGDSRSWESWDYSKVMSYDDSMTRLTDLGLPVETLSSDSNYAIVNVAGPGWLTYFAMTSYSESTSCDIKLKLTEYGTTTADCYSYIMVIPTNMMAGSEITINGGMF